MPLYSFVFDVHPRPDSREYGHIRTREVEIWIPKNGQSAVAQEARRIVNGSGYEIDWEGEVREWDVTSEALRSTYPLRELLPAIRREGFAFVYCWADEA